MIMIPTLHVLGHGGIIDATAPLTSKNESIWILEAFAYCGVNIFGLITGYVSFGRKHNISKLIDLCFQVLFYTMVSTIMFFIIKPEMVGLKEIITAIFPYAYGAYWYFSAYFLLFFLMPWLDKAVQSLNKKSLLSLLITIYFTFSFLPTLFHSNFAKTDALGGYSFLWLAILYLTGAAIKKYEFQGFEKNIKNLLICFFMVVISWASKILIEIITIKVFGTPVGETYLISYTSPTIILYSIYLLLFFRRLTLNKSAIYFTKVFAPVCFGVYLLHEEPLVREYFIVDKFKGIVNYPIGKMFLCIIGAILGIWLLGSAIDWIRILLFKTFRIKNLSGFVGTKFDNIENKCIERIYNLMQRSKIAGK